MASNVNPGQIPVVSLLHGSQAASSVGIPASGKPLPAAKAAPAETPPSSASSVAPHDNTLKVKVSPPPVYTAAAKAAVPRATDSQSAQSITNALNKHLNDSGRPAQFRVDPESGDKLIQEVNPANGEVVGEFPVDEFPALARSIGASGLIIDNLA
jgi:uncharacterized FlaG/YvyC family protein